MKELTLYSQEIEQTEGINGFTSIVIFSDGGTDEVWGNEDENCNPFSFCKCAWTKSFICVHVHFCGGRLSQKAFPA